MSDELESLLAQIQSTIDQAKKNDPTVSSPILPPRMTPPSSPPPVNNFRTQTSLTSWPTMNLGGGSRAPSQLFGQPYTNAPPTSPPITPYVPNEIKNNQKVPLAMSLSTSMPTLPNPPNSRLSTQVATALPTPSLTAGVSPMMTSLKAKMAELAASIRSHSKKIADLEEEKAQAVASENFAAAIQLKKDLDTMMVTEREFTINMMKKCELLKKGMAMERSIIDIKITYLSGEKKRLEELIESTEAEKKECVRKEDYEGALQCKKKIDDIQFEWKKKCDL
ncbi:hypothetical protein PROFUN_11121 [Planoprotostelium fungivorum]|uniref:UVR domain-containing protein n=1 Tax=Planoprotostelium fungivorum TaxID=1890364 RepID=A0A2P6NAT1_9EUKA|nr:hypothetical protein PROFUN_11121 [Planoprotostelium fungivorum]